MDTRPTPTGGHHWLDVRLRHAPASRHTDLLQALDDMNNGLEQPVRQWRRSAVAAERQPTWLSLETPESPSQQESRPAQRLLTAFQ